MASCGECRFSNLVIFPDGPNMECRRYPPSFMVIEDEPSIAFPQVKVYEWCGEFKPDNREKE